ncbi:MAG: phospho-N-acetylmuramoyl-pentapeptide-transferase [Candidatus Delongbacteria bacterium]|nr:phospho-N-acetylmuramoyl-pentapeptide-transferase [Candidatus Delongbacteria bacterium]MBN2833920.1 phospho-N-acetylmuramoyl-pentapeptide-transferase [Candidatus Delongbacteria bacterium]
MFYYLYNLSRDYEFLSFFRLFDSILFRSTAAMISSLLISIIFGRYIINFLYKIGMRDVVRDYQGISTNDKKGTPTMGGVLIIISVLISTLLWNNLGSVFPILSIFSMVSFGLLGVYDDYSKVKHGHSDKGLSQLPKFILQLSIAGIIAYILVISDFTPYKDGESTKLYIPFIKNNFSFDLGYFQLLFVIFTIVSIANAVNFTDGMDGLAVVPSVSTAAVFGFLAYIIGNVNFSSYLLYTYIPNVSEITIISASLVGAGMGFLWFNSYPASVFMGDTGSMAIGGLLAVIAVSAKQELLFIIAGGIFVGEAFSSLIQEKVGIKILGRRLFFRAPIHDTFRHMGLSEPKIVQRFWIVSIMLSLASLLSIKVR